MLSSATTRMYDTIYNRMGVPASYTDADGAVRPSVRVIVERNLSQYGDVAEIKAGSAVVAVRVSEVPDRPRRDDTFALADGETLYVDSVMIADGFEYRCMAHGR